MPSKRNRAYKRLNTLSKLLTDIKFIVIAAVSALAYYYIFGYVVSASNYGIFISTVPLYLILSIAITSGMLFAISIYSLMNSLRRLKMAVSGSTISTITTLSGGLVSGCACSVPFLSTLLYSIGISSIGVSDFIIAVNSNQFAIISAIIIINIALVYYYLGKLKP